mgnify:CR=1 FL=1
MFPTVVLSGEQTPDADLMSHSTVPAGVALQAHIYLAQGGDWADIASEQAERGGTDEGFSIPAQREANARKADELGARIVREFIDAGESARSADRDGLQDMLAFIAASRVTFCIVHKLDRLARNRADDVKIHEALINAGVTLVSATESIDQTPSGMLVHGIMSSIAEFYSRNLATEVTKGLTQKVAQGGTPGRAPIGYLNVRQTDEQGREIRTVKVDPERAPLISWAFERYATGETSFTGLLRDLTARGLLTLPTPKRPSKPLGKNTLYKLLTNPYYAGVIRYKGALYPGAHEPIVEPALFDTVQSLLRARTAKMTRHVQHAHHLKGLLHCGTCGSRMLLDFATNPRGTTYAYFICSGRAAKKNDAIATLGMTPAHYYLVLGRLVDKPEALMENPELIRRLRRLRAQRAAERHGDRNSWSVRGDDSVGDAIG